MDQSILVFKTIIAGLIPALIWLFFWTREYRDDPEPMTLILMCFLFGMLSTILVLPFEQLIKDKYIDQHVLTIFWAFLEELIKYFVAITIIKKTKFLKKPIDYPIFFITVALGFAALENALFFMTPLANEPITTSLLTGNLRFLGATLLHSSASAMIGLALGLSFYGSWLKKKIHLFVGLFTAVVLHSLFNFFIIQNDGKNFLTVFSFLWFVTVVVLLVFEKVRRIQVEIPTGKITNNPPLSNNSTNNIQN